MCINRQNTRETGGKELSVSLYFLDGIKYNETITEAGRNASIFYYEETAGGLLWQGEKVRAETRQKVQAKAS